MPRGGAGARGPVGPEAVPVRRLSALALGRPRRLPCARARIETPCCRPWPITAAPRGTR